MFPPLGGRMRNRIKNGRTAAFLKCECSMIICNIQYFQINMQQKKFDDNIPFLRLIKVEDRKCAKRVFL